MSVYAWLAPLAPYLAGEWRLLGYAVIALPLCVALWAVFGRRWRPDGVRRCTKCSHAFDPAERFDREAGVRCTECGHVVRTEAAALARRGRVQVFVAGILVAFLVSLPLLAWHSVHVFLARAILPRWVTTERADFPNGLVLVQEIDPVQYVLDWAPNPDSSAWQANFDEPVGDGSANTMWPDHWRLRAWTDPAHPSATSYMGPCQFGVEFAASDWSSSGSTMPTVGAPGFGADITGDGEPDVIVGELNTGSGGGITWIRITLPEEAAQNGGPSFSVIGMGMFHRDEAHGDWVFMSTCHGFRYMFAPGAAGVLDPETSALGIRCAAAGPRTHRACGANRNGRCLRARRQRRPVPGMNASASPWTGTTAGRSMNPRSMPPRARVCRRCAMRAPRADSTTHAPG